MKKSNILLSILLVLFAGISLSVFAGGSDAVSDLKKQISALELRNKHLENRIEEMVKSPAAAAAHERGIKVQKQSVTINNLENEKAKLVAQLNSLTSNNEKEDWERTKRENMKVIKALSKDLTDNIKVADGLRVENERLMLDIENSARERDNLLDQINDLAKSGKRTEKDYSKLESKLKKEKENVSELKTDLSVAEDVIDDLEDAIKEKNKSGRKNIGKIADIEEDMASLSEDLAESIKFGDSLEKDLENAKAGNSKLKKEMAELKNKKTDIRGSDLFQKIERANYVMREKLVELETKRHKAVKSMEKMKSRDERHDDEIKEEREKRKEAEEKIEEALEREEEHKELLEKLMADIPVLEDQVFELEKQNLALTQKLQQGTESVRSLKVELQKREHRLDKAERVAEVLNEAREEVLHVNDMEKRDMHYNMAAVYVKEERFHDAEIEYLRALKIDPVDADIHYNLAILYDDELGDLSKAISHYRRYLKLNPHGSDADLVRDWLMKLDMDR